MNGQTDQQLLRDYAGRRSEAAFAEVVRRHVDLVYSAARRMVCDADLAQDVTQQVFMALAQNARQLTDRPVLSGWLHRTAQNLAANAVRADVRRRAREQEAATMNESQESDAVWSQIAPHLDEALEELSESDRDVVLLRYFDRKSAREMAEVLGIGEEAAQKRVSRAVERLREFLAKRGLTIGASGLAVVITGNAVQAAPVGLAATISTAAALAGTALQTSSAIVATKTIAMTTLQKTIIGATLAAAVGTGIYEARRASQLRGQNQILRQQQASLSKQSNQLTRDHEEAAKKLVALQQDNDQLRKDTVELARLRAEISRLRRQGSDLSELKDKNQRLRTALETPAAPDPAIGDAPQLAQRVFSIASTNFVQNLDLQVQGREDETVTDKLQRYFALNGVKAEPVPRVVLDERSGSVIVASSPTNLYAIEPLIGYLNAAK